MATKTSRIDVTTMLESQHEQVRALFDQIGDGTTPTASDSFCELRRLLAVHETGEEMVIYPALRKIDAEAVRIAKERLAEEDAAKAALHELETIGLNEPGFAAKIVALRAAVLAHAEAEEREVFPRIRAATSTTALRTMGMALQRAEDAAPTHPHPHAPQSAIGNLVGGP
ncbi:MAG TPA: hemerythrin domain-containing protein, partial [Acidimicrobiia bacterium]